MPHDLNQAARHATQLIAIRDCQVVEQGASAEVVTELLVEEAFGLPKRVVPSPVTCAPLVLPLDRKRAGRGRPAEPRRI